MNALITGASKGIGRAIALKLAEQGYNLIICARNEEDLLAIAKEAEQFQVKVMATALDCSDKERLLDFYNEVISTVKTIDVLVNNVGVFLPGNLFDESDENFEKQLFTNLSSAYYLGKRVGKLMRERGSGHIFNICSIASTEVVEQAGSYSVTKAALLSLNDVMRATLAPHNVKVTAILPGATWTDSWKGSTIASEKFIQASDIADVVYAALSMSVGAQLDRVILRPVQLNS